MDCQSEPDRTIFTVRSAAKNLRHRLRRFFTPLRFVQNDTLLLIQCDRVLGASIVDFFAIGKQNFVLA